MFIPHKFSNPWVCQLFPLMNNLLIDACINSYSLCLSGYCLSVYLPAPFLPLPHSLTQRYEGNEKKKQQSNMVWLETSHVSRHPPVKPIHLQCLSIFIHLFPTYFYTLYVWSLLLCFFELLHIPISKYFSSYNGQKYALIFIMFFKSCAFSHLTFLEIQHIYSFFLVISAVFHKMPRVAL